jgi:hypothetical protein
MTPIHVFSPMLPRDTCDYVANSHQLTDQHQRQTPSRDETNQPITVDRVPRSANSLLGACRVIPNDIYGAAFYGIASTQNCYTQGTARSTFLASATSARRPHRGYGPERFELLALPHAPRAASIPGQVDTRSSVIRVDGSKAASRISIGLFSMAHVSLTRLDSSRSAVRRRAPLSSDGPSHPARSQRCTSRGTFVPHGLTNSCRNAGGPPIS